MRINLAKTLGVIAAAGIMLGWVVQGRAQNGAPTCRQCQASYHPCGTAQCRSCPTLKWLLDCSYSTVSPDHGWNKVQKHPIVRRGVTYQKYWPAQWYGQQARGPQRPMKWHPMIATPTDTTQLGYYYQRVPTWQPNPAMLPPRPDPRLWHDRSCMPAGVIITTPQQQTAPAPSAPTPVEDPAVPPAPQTTAMLGR